MCKNLADTIAHCKALSAEGSNRFQKDIPDISIQNIVDESFRGNMHLFMVCSTDTRCSEEEFLLASLQALTYEVEDMVHELASFTISHYTYSVMMEELGIEYTKELLARYTVGGNGNSNISLIKLKEKNELSFLIRTDTYYIFVQEIFWRS